MEFAKSRAKRTYAPVCLHTSVAYVPTCQKRANFSFSRANVPINVPTYQRANMLYGVPMFQIGVPTCETACQVFKHPSYEMLRKVSILYY